jgi:uncharacterized cupredoxin-like copper-binding protein
MLRRRAVPLLSLTCIAILAACADQGAAFADDEEQQEVVAVRMTEYAFEASHVELVAGTPYRFLLRNDGVEAHEWAVVPHGDPTEDHVLTEVEEHDLPPGAVVEHVFTFDEPGTYDMACFLEGHYEAGMVLPVTVTPRAPTPP